MDLVQQVRQTIITERLLDEGNTLIVAVSGGPDSVALLHVLQQLAAEWRLQLVVAHVNHQFRREESELEAQTVEQLAKKLGLPFELGLLDVPAYIKEHKRNAQVAARELRYRFFMQTAKQYGAEKIALAHHADDQAETLLMRLIRGTGPSGLAGIPIRRLEQGIELIRPFLHCLKWQLVEYCQQHQLVYHQDSSNVKTDYHRNQVRLDILPYLMRWNKRLPQVLQNLSVMMQDEDHFMEEETQRTYKQLVTFDQGSCKLSRKAFLGIPTALQRRLIKLILSYLSAEPDIAGFTKLEAIRTAIIQTATPSLLLHIEQSIVLQREYDQIRFGAPQQARGSQDYAYKIDKFPWHQRIYEAGVQLHCEVKPYRPDDHPSSVNYGKGELYLDADRIKLPLCVRPRRAGDRMQVAGLGGTKKVKDLFIDEKLPPSRRNVIPLIVDANQQVLWIPGVRYAEQAELNEHTTQVVHMKVEDFI